MCTRCGGVVSGAGSGTTAVGADDSDAEPTSFVAVTRERSVEPTSSAVTVYVFPSAIGVQSGWQRSHWKVSLIGAVPVHWPSVEVSVCPTSASPRMTGWLTSTGVPDGGAGSFETVTVTSADAVAEPRPNAVTFRRWTPFRRVRVSRRPFAL